MSIIERLQEGDKKVISNNFFSGDFRQDLVLKKSKDDGSHKDKYYLELYSKVNGLYRQQAYIYFYLDYKNKTCYFIGMKTEEEFRGLNMGSLLISVWIDFCLNNGIEYLGVNSKQRKPFLLYMLKNFTFDVENIEDYNTRNDVISLYKGNDFYDNSKYLLFRDENHEKQFKHNNTFKDDNYVVLDYITNEIFLTDIIFPIQNITRNPAEYYLKDKEIAAKRCRKIMKRHKI